MPSNSTILISGAGIAGPSLAYWLLRHGFRPTLVETAPRFREGGYLIDFWGIGYDVAEKMGLIPALRHAGYDMTDLRLVDRAGRDVAAIGVRSFRDATHNRFFSIARGDLAREIYRCVEGEVETIFGDSIVSLDQDESGVDAGFAHAGRRRFDLVVGADGLHSAVRRIAFGPEEHFEKFLGYYAASFIVDNYPHRDEGAYVSHTVPGRQIARYALRGGRTAFLFIWVEDKKLALPPHDHAAKIALLRARFRDMGWEAREILAVLNSDEDLYFDSVSQIRMDKWSSGRIALAGDAGYCPSLLAGQGSAFAMAGAYILAGELHAAGGDHATAFRNYQQKFGAYVRSKQNGAIWLGSWFAPKTALGLKIRDSIAGIMGVPSIANVILSRTIAEKFVLPAYET